MRQFPNYPDETGNRERLLSLDKVLEELQKTPEKTGKINSIIRDTKILIARMEKEVYTQLNADDIIDISTINSR
jgi:5-bromo-4-chloroindolyl phosphate hydrolysis protein